MYTCADCKRRVCLTPDKNDLPENCPMRNEQYVKEMQDGYMNPEINRFYIATKTAAGPDTPRAKFIPRLRYVIDLCKKMGYKKLGFAFCVGFRDEARLYSKILRGHGFEVVSVGCCNGGFNIADHGVPLPSNCDFDAACNPIGQARLMNEQNVDFNLVMGLCAGHDSLFLKYANAMSTVITVKDPATGHCPPAALYLYDTYYKDIFEEGMVKK